MTVPTDAGRAVQRTVLAWQRTGLGLVGLGALLLHGAGGGSGAAQVALGVGVAGGGVALASAGAAHRRRAVTGALLAGRSPASPGTTGLLTLVVVGVCVAAAALLS